MTKYRRILLELLAPPFIATIALVVTSYPSETLFGILAGFLPLLMFAYLFGIIPAVLYTIGMEFWFQLGLRVRCGLLCTVGLSVCLGAGAGFLSATLATWFGVLTEAECLYFLRVGGLIGSLIGYYVGRKQILAV
jgi:hypothetical protein